MPRSLMMAATTDENERVLGLEERTIFVDRNVEKPHLSLAHLLPNSGFGC